jgi:hypothetical protein
LLVLASGGDFGVNQDTRVALSSPVHAQEPLCLNGTLGCRESGLASAFPAGPVIGLVQTRPANRACGCGGLACGFRLCAGPWCWRKNRIISAEELGPCASV